MSDMYRGVSMRHQYSTHTKYGYGTKKYSNGATGWNVVTDNTKRKFFL